MSFQVECFGEVTVEVLEGVLPLPQLRPSLLLHLQDQAHGVLLQQVCVEGGAPEEELLLEAIEVVQPPHRVFTQQLKQATDTSSR